MEKRYKANYHAHTPYCKHATGTMEDYVYEAIKHNMNIIGISEHAPLDGIMDDTYRLPLKDFPNYIKEAQKAKKLAKENGIEFYIGLEMEYFEEFKHYQYFMDSLDYMILSQHYIKENGEFLRSAKLKTLEHIKEYKRLAIISMRTGYFNILAHPDLCFFSIPNPSNEMYEELRELIKVAKELDIPLEINANGLRYSKKGDSNPTYKEARYPKLRFWEMVKEEEAKVIINSDSHDVNNLYDWSIDECYKMVDDLKLNLVNKAKVNYF